MLEVLYQSWHSRSDHLGIGLATFFFYHHSCQHLHLSVIMYLFFYLLFICLLIYLFICLFNCLFVCLFICLFAHSLIHSFNPSFISSFAIYSFIYLFIHSLFVVHMSAVLVGTLHFDIQASLNVYIGFWQQFALKMTSETISEHEFFSQESFFQTPLCCVCASHASTDRHASMVVKCTFSHQDPDLAQILLALALSTKPFRQ